jgi:hypothetical protein
MKDCVPSCIYMSSSSCLLYFECCGYSQNCKGFIFDLSVSFMGCVHPYIDGLPIVYTVSGVDLSLQAGCLCASTCALNS